MLAAKAHHSEEQQTEPCDTIELKPAYKDRDDSVLRIDFPRGWSLIIPTEEELDMWEELD